MLCCAFGGILLAFLILVATSKRDAFPSTAFVPTAPRADPPLVILATRSETAGTLPSTPLFHIQTEEHGTKEWSPDRLEGPDHAVLLAECLPPAMTVITLRREPLKSSEPDAHWQISIILDGHRFEQELTTRFEHPIPLWPLRQDDRSDTN